MEFKVTIQRLVFNVLTESEKSRDDWMLAVKKIHELEMRIYGIQKSEYFDALFSDKLTNVQTVSRIWRKIQEDFPALRGDEWESRQTQGGQISKKGVSLDKSQLCLFNQEESDKMALFEKDENGIEIIN
jgi:hypothetical protein